MLLTLIECDEHACGDETAIIDFRDRVEAALGQLFELEQRRVDIRLSFYGPLDVYECPLFVHVKTDADHDENIELIADKLFAILRSEIHEVWTEPLDLRLWISESYSAFIEK